MTGAPATFLSWSPDVRRGFNEEVRHYVGSLTEVPPSQGTKPTMAQVLATA